MPDILIRSDGSSTEGIGHIVRSATIAGLFLKCGKTVKILCGSNPDFIRLFPSLGIEVIPVSSDEVEDIKALKPDILITDLPPRRDRTALSDFAARQRIFHVTINDLMLSGGSSNLCINPSIVPLPVPRRNTFSGAQYAVLNKKVTDSSTSTATLSKEVNRVFLSMGGTDPGNLTEMILSSLLPQLSHLLEVFVISTKISPKTLSLSKSFKNLHIAKNPENIGGLLKESDIAIISGGITLYESCFSGVPAIVIPQNPFQEMTGKAFERENAALLLNTRDIFPENSISKVFSKLAEDFETRKQISKNGRTLVDGKGGQRVVNLILESYHKFCKPQKEHIA